MSLTELSTTVVLDVYDHDTTPLKFKSIALDSKTRYVNAHITDHDEPYDIGQGTTVTLTVIRPDKTGVQITGTAEAYSVYMGDSEVTMYGARAELTQTALAVSGTLQAQFMLTSGDQILRTEIFTINNGVALDATVSEWAGEYQGYNLDELVQSVNNAVATVEGMESDVDALKADFARYEGIFTADVDESIQNWLDEHPEATTTILDGSITTVKLADGNVTKSKLSEEFKTAETTNANARKKLVHIDVSGARGLPSSTEYTSFQGVCFDWHGFAGTANYGRFIQLRG